jgi:uncharacterized membrane protein YcaP (DUF421 family)
MADIEDWVRDWNEVGDAVLAAILFYVLIVAAVRIFGKRSTAQLNNFDWIINITVGSLAASGILLETVPAIRAVAAIATLMMLQFLMTWLALRYQWVNKVIKASPTLLTHRGEFLEDAMRKTRISHEEICAALREHGIPELEGANWVILETDGKLTVIPKQDVKLTNASAMANVEGTKMAK